jgi:4,5-dihydroxyphthalate decarboxylase
VTTTTGVWLRGILANDYGVDLDSIYWVTTEEPHVDECEDRSRRAPPGCKLIDMLLDGELDAVLGEGAKHPRLRTLFADPLAEATHWHARHGVIPINHLVVVSTDLVEREPEAVREVYQLLQLGKASVPARHPDPIPFGIEACRPALDLLAGYVHQLGLTPERYSVEQIFAPVRHLVD